MKALKYKITLTAKTCIVAVIAVVILAAGCKKNEFLLPDRNALDENIWKDKGAVQLFLNGCYSFIMPDFPFVVAENNVIVASDESVFNWSDALLKKAMGLGGAVLLANDVKVIGSKQQGKNKGENKYSDLYRCNLAIMQLHKSDNPLPAEAKKEFLGQFYTLRAIAYFDLTRTYGGVPLVLEPLDPANVPLIGRSSAADCFKAILSDLDSAIVNLENVTYSAADVGKINKYAATAFKARVMLYQASPQFNPQTYPGYTFDQSKWEKALEANKKAYDLCVAGGYRLMDKYEDIFLKEGPANTEAIMVRSHSEKLPKRSTDVESWSRPGGSVTNGAQHEMFVATDSLIAAYTMDDGSPINATGSGYDGYFYWKNRDPRFAATIAYNGSNWALNGVAARKQWTYENETEGAGKPFYCKRFSIASLPAGSVKIVEDIGGNGMDWIEIRFAEVLLNYAECLNETGNIGEAKNKVRELRTKRGIKAGAHDFGLDYANDKNAMRKLILNERRVEFAFEGKRGADLRRTRTLHLLTGTISSSREKVVSAALKTQLEEVNPANGLRRRDTLDLNKKSTLQYFFTRVPNGAGNTGASISIPETYYFLPLPSAFLLSSPLMVQTIGWEGGTFDPLK